MPRQVAKWKGDDRPSKSSDANLDDHSADEQDEKRKKQNPLEFPFPDHWSKTSGWSPVDVPANSDEYANVAEAFRSEDQTLGYYKTTIVKITRIQNPALRRQYQLRRSLILEKVGQGKLNERHLWHGTSLHIAQTISLQGFDFRVNPTHGRAYGDGIYFAPRPGLAITFGFQAPKVPATRKGDKRAARRQWPLQRWRRQAVLKLPREFAAPFTRSGCVDVRLKGDMDIYDLRSSTRRTGAKDCLTLATTVRMAISS